MAETESIYISQRSAKSLVLSVAHWVTFYGGAAVGFYVGSPAMEWTGLVIGILGTISYTYAYGKSQYKTPQQAADYLARKYGVTSKKAPGPDAEDREFV